MRCKPNLPRIAACLLGALAGVASPPSEGQVTEARALGALFADDEPLTLRLEAPIATLKRSADDPQYSPGRLSYLGADGAAVAVDLRVRVRGKSRLAACSFPPLRLDIRTRDLVGTLLEGQNRLKLVTHCEPRAANAQWVYLEYLAYRVLNLVTRASLRARPVEVTYFDTERGREVASGPGILLEDEERFAERQNWHPIKEPTLNRARYDQSALALVAAFQYFIGNTDWSALAASSGDSECCHNVVPLARDDGMLVPIVYDFDSSGIVDTSYALPDERLGISTVRQRLYRGTCLDPAALQASLEPFLAQRQEIRALYESYPKLTKRSRDSALAYIDQFYQVLADPKRVDRAFRSGCSQ
jgi:hypothetical protein